MQPAHVYMTTHVLLLLRLRMGIAILRIRYSDSLRVGRSGDRIPVEARFSAPVQTGPGAYPVSCIMDTGSFQKVKRPGLGTDHPPPSKCQDQERVVLYLYSPSGPQWRVIGRIFTFNSYTFTPPLFLHVVIREILMYYNTDLSKIFLN